MLDKHTATLNSSQVYENKDNCVISLAKRKRLCGLCSKCVSERSARNDTFTAELPGKGVTVYVTATAKQLITFSKLARTPWNVSWNISTHQNRNPAGSTGRARTDGASNRHFGYRNALYARAAEEKVEGGETGFVLCTLRLCGSRRNIVVRTANEGRSQCLTTRPQGYGGTADRFRRGKLGQQFQQVWLPNTSSRSERHFSVPGVVTGASTRVCGVAEANLLICAVCVHLSRTVTAPLRGSECVCRTGFLVGWYRRRVARELREHTAYRPMCCAN